MWKIQGGAFFAEMVISWFGGEYFKCIDGNKRVGLDCLVRLYLPVPSCPVYPSLYHIKSSLPPKPWAGLTFSRKLYSLYLALIPPAAWYLLCGVAINFCLLLTFMCLFFLLILKWSWGQALRWNIWAFPPWECRTWCLGAGFRCPQGSILFKVRVNTVQGADQLFVIQLRWLLNWQVS